MAVNDPIGDMIARIRNAQMRSKSKVSMPGSKQRERVLEVLKTEGFIRGYASVAHASGRSELEIELKYFDGEPVIREIERVSKPGRRVYVAVRNLPVSTMALAYYSIDAGRHGHFDAREANVGGEIICTVFDVAPPRAVPALLALTNVKVRRSKAKGACGSLCMTMFRSPWTKAIADTREQARLSMWGTSRPWLHVMGRD
jgi:small subunit ribosomal protein S8